MYYLVAGAAALAVLEQGLVAAGRHGRERRQVHVLESTGATCMNTVHKWMQVCRSFMNTARDRHAPATAIGDHVHTNLPSSYGPAPVGAPYQVALAASQLGSAVKAEALKLTGGGLAHEPYETRREEIVIISAPSATTLDEPAIMDSIVVSY